MKSNIRPFNLAFASVMMSTTLFSSFASASEGTPLEVYRLRPQRIGLASSGVRLLRGLKTPIIYDVTLDSRVVTALLPVAMEPRLVRADAGKFEKKVNTPGFINEVKEVLRESKKRTDITDSSGLAALLPNFQTHNFVITSDAFTFGKAGKAKMLDKFSKHAMISKDLQDVRFAGQMWRDGVTLCLNGNSGTYMKKRKSAGLSEEPDTELVIQILSPVFAPALTVLECRMIAPGFGGHEALDQAQKAELSVKLGEAALAAGVLAPESEKLTNAITNARIAAVDAHAASKAALLAAKTKHQAREEYLRLDLVAAEAAAHAKEMRKKIEKILEKAAKARGLDTLNPHTP